MILKLLFIIVILIIRKFLLEFFYLFIFVRNVENLVILFRIV